eukprot:1156375-Pelagomonas_calceolata.AAC.1
MAESKGVQTLAPSAAMPMGGARWAMRLRRRVPSRPAAKCHMGMRNPRVHRRLHPAQPCPWAGQGGPNEAALEGSIQACSMGQTPKTLTYTGHNRNSSVSRRASHKQH